MALSLVPNETPIEDIAISSTGLVIEAIQILGPCNGVVYLASFSSTASTIVLCNPSMKEFRLLPQPSYKSYHASVLGFGFDHITNNYKVVRFGMMNINSGVTAIDKKVEIYDLSTDSWRDVDAESPVKSGFYCSGHLSISWNGDFFWYANCYGHNGGAAIVAFSMTNEVFKEMPVPEICMLDRHIYKKLFLLKDSLALAINQERGSQNRAELCFDIWVMNGEDVEVWWTRKFTIGPFQGFHEALGFRKNGEFIVWSSCGQMSCNLYTGERKEYQGHYQSHACLSVLQFLVYTESLVSVKRQNEHNEHVEPSIYLHYGLL